MKSLIITMFVVFSMAMVAQAQSTEVRPSAGQIVQPSQSLNPEVNGANADTSRNEIQPAIVNDVKIPAGTPIEVESAYTVNSRDVKAGELLSFRVLIPITVDGKVVIPKDALVTARVVQAKRGGHWGKAGRLTWTMLDVMAVDNTRIPLAPETSVYHTDVKATSRNGKAAGRVTGTSHGGEVATRTIVMAALIPPLAPLALINGFKRGGDAVLPEGKRFVVMVKHDSTVALQRQD